jgi:hypothetical protein
MLPLYMTDCNFFAGLAGESSDRNCEDWHPHDFWIERRRLSVRDCFGWRKGGITEGHGNFARDPRGIAALIVLPLIMFMLFRWPSIGI